MPIATLQEFLRKESAAGLCLIAASALALLVANTGLEPFYRSALALPFTVSLGDFGLSKPLLLWINDGLMAVFFFLVGLEVKRELAAGELSSPATAALPAIGAFGGMVVPAAIYAAINWQDAEALRGWAIPAATDIAFALCVLSLLGNRVPVALKVLLTAIAIFDDLGAIIIIAVFYTADLSAGALALAGLLLAALAAMNRFGVGRVAAYALVGTLLWVCVLKSGVHATLAGVATALAVPLKDGRGEPVLANLEHALHPWVAFLIVPVFGFANAGVSFAGLGREALAEPVTLGIVLGLFVGKQIGVFLPVYGAIRAGIAPMPTGAGWLQIYAVAILCGIGFTMSLFIGGLAFTDPAMAAPLRLGVFVGSMISAGAGYALLKWTLASR